MSTTALNTAALLQATALNRYYGDYQAVNDFNLTLNKGEVLGLLGPNGAGKSSTMQMLTGNISPSSGEILVNGISLIEEPELAKKAIGYLPEQPPVYRDMTVAEYLKYCAALRGIPKSQKQTLIAEASERCGLQDVSNKLIGNLSKGFQQRVGIAQAILHKPELVILDEPTVGLDPLQINQIRKLIRKLGEDYAVILSTHILPEVQAVCDRVQIINQGKTVFSDHFSELTKKQTASEVIVAFKDSVDVSKLEALPSIDKVEVLNTAAESHRMNKRYRLTFTKNDKAQDASIVSQLANKQGWELTELSPQADTLEQIFMNLIYSEDEQDTSIEEGFVPAKPEVTDE